MSIDPRLGSELAGYRIDQFIGRGGMGVVYLAEDLTLGRKVALKLLAPELAQDPKFRERFVRESRLAASLEHPNIITIYEARERDGLLYISMRFVQGTDLKALIESQGALDPARAIRILTQVASALDAAHAEGLIHRDVKPGNILITPGSEPGTPDRVYLSDFGLTKRTTSDSGITATGQFVGSLDYAAPEQFEGKALDGRADQYSLACVLFECLTGEVPFKRDNEAAMVYAHLLGEPPKPSERRPELPKGMDPVVTRGMAKKPEDRFASCQDLVAAAGDELGVEPSAPSIPGRRLPIPAPAKRHRRIPLPALIGFGALVVAAIVTPIILATRGGSKQAASPPPSLSPGGVVQIANALTRLDAANGKVGTTIRLGHPLHIVNDVRTGDERGIALGGEGSVWVTNGDDNSVSRIDPISDKAVTIDVGHPTRTIALGSGAAWVAADLSNRVFRIDPAQNKVVAEVDTGGTVYSLAVDPATGSVWALTEAFLKHIDPASNSVDRSILVPGFTPVNAGNGVNLTFFPFISIGSTVGDGSLWVALPNGNLVRLDLTTNKAIKIAVGGALGSVAVDPATGSVWVTQTTGGAKIGSLIQVDPATNKVINQIGVSCCPGTIAAGGGSIWVTDQAHGSVVQISASTGAVVGTFDVGKSPSAIAAGQDVVWVAVDKPAE